MTDRPIIFSAPMVLALLDGRKTMTRRLAWQEPQVAIRIGDGPVEPIMVPTLWQRAQLGDRLWVRESFAVKDCGRLVKLEAGMLPRVQYVATDKPPQPDYWWNTRPSIHMPRWASRLTLIVTAVKIERLQDISDADCIAEGPPNVGVSRILGTMMVVPDPDNKPGISQTVRCWYRELWSKLHGTESWLSNPEVVALTFTVHRGNVDALSEAA